MRTRMSPNMRVRHHAQPFSPLCSVGWTLVQSVVPKGMLLILMRLPLSIVLALPGERSCIAILVGIGRAARDGVGTLQPSCQIDISATA